MKVGANIPRERNHGECERQAKGEEEEQMTLSAMYYLEMKSILGNGKNLGKLSFCIV